MSYYKKNLITILTLLCLTMTPVSITYSQQNLTMGTKEHDQFNVRITKETFTEFSDSLIIPDTNEKIPLNQLFSYSISHGISIESNPNILSFNAAPSGFEILRKQENTHNTAVPNVYNISLSDFKHKPENHGQTPKEISTEFPSIKSAEIIKQAYDNPQKIIEEAKKLLDSGDKSSTNTLLDGVLNSISDNSWLLAEVAGIYEQTKNYNKAHITYEKAIKLNPNRIELLYSHALCLINSDKLDQAEEKLLKITGLYPQFTLAYYNLGTIYFKKNQYYKALQEFNQVIKLNPLSADAYYNIALTLEILNHNKLSIKYYTKCLEIKPNDTQALSGLKRLKQEV